MDEMDSRVPIDWARTAALLVNNHYSGRDLYSDLTRAEMRRLEQMRTVLDDEKEALAAQKFDDEMETFGISGTSSTYDQGLADWRAARARRA